MSSILIEYVLKYCSFKIELEGAKYSEAKWMEFDDMTFSKAINRTAQNQLLDKDVKKELERFRVTIRNPYNHYNLHKITGDLAVPVTIVDSKTGNEQSKKIRAGEQIAIQAQIKPAFDASRVIEVFRFADDITRYLLKQLPSPL